MLTTPTVLRKVAALCRQAALEPGRSSPELLALASAGDHAQRLAEALETPPPQMLCDTCGRFDPEHPGRRCASCSGTTYLADPVPGLEGSSLR